MIRCAPMGSIHRPSDCGRESTNATGFVQCVDGQEPHIHEFLCLGLERMIRKVHPTALVEVTDGTVREFVTNYLDENGRRIHIIGKISVNDSVQFWNVPNQGGRSGLPFI